MRADAAERRKRFACYQSKRGGKKQTYDEGLGSWDFSNEGGEYSENP